MSETWVYLGICRNVWGCIGEKGSGTHRRGSVPRRALKLPLLHTRNISYSWVGGYGCHYPSQRLHVAI